MNCCKRHGNQARNKYQRKRAFTLSAAAAAAASGIFSGLATEVKKNNTQGRLQVQCAAAMENARPLLRFPFFFLCAVAESP
jgi:hypothetical protein